MNTEVRLREYLAAKGAMLDVTGRPSPEVAPRPTRHRMWILAVAAVAALIVVGLPLVLLFSRSPTPPAVDEPPIVDEPPLPKEAVELDWSTGLISNGLFGNVIEVPDGWLFIPQIPDSPAWASSDGASWEEVGALFPADASVFGVVWNDLGYLAYEGYQGEFGPTGSLRHWRSDDGTTWVEADVDEFREPLPAESGEFITYLRVGEFAASRDRMAFAGFLAPEIDLDAVARSLGIEPADGDIWGEIIGEGPGGELSGELSLQRNGEEVWRATFEQLGFDQDFIARLHGQAPTDIHTWASSDGGHTWARGEALPAGGSFQSLGATDDGFALTTWSTQADGRPGGAMRWVSSDGLHWREAGGDPELYKLEAAADRFLGAALETPDELWTSSTGDSWVLAGEDMDGFPDHEAASFWGGRAGFVLLKESNDEAGALSWTVLYSPDGYTWAEVGISGELSPPDYSGVEFAGVNIGDHSVAIIERDLDGNLIVHIGLIGD